MISFKHRNTVKRLQLAKNVSEERLGRMIGQMFPVKGPVLGFKTESGQYYDTETFCRNKGKFYGEVVQVMQATDQLQMSFTSDNLSTSLVQPPQQQQRTTTSQLSNLGYIHQLKNIQKVVMTDPCSLTLIFLLQDQRPLRQLTVLANRHQQVTMLYHLLSSRQKFGVTPPLYMVYMGKRKVCEMAMHGRFVTKVETAILRWGQLDGANGEGEHGNNCEVQEEEDDCPSFVTNDRISPGTVEEYLNQMAAEMLLSEPELTRLMEMAENRFAEFYRSFCRGLVDNDYESFKQEILDEVQRHRDAEQRPISRQQQRKSNLKKSVSDISLVTVDNYLQILNGLSDLILQDQLHTIRNLLIEENSEAMGYFSGYLARQYDRQTLANNLVITAAGMKNVARPISRCVPRQHNKRSENRVDEREREREPAQKEVVRSDNRRSQRKKESDRELDMNTLQEQLTKLEEVPEFGQSRKPQKSQPLQPQSPCPSPDIQMTNSAPPFLTPAAPAPNANTFSPLKAMQQQSLQHSYHNAQSLITAHLQSLSPQQSGLLLHLLKTLDPSICQLVQQIEQNPQRSLPGIRNAMALKLENIFKAEFTSHEIEFIQREKRVDGAPVNCYYENFRYEGELEVFLGELRREVQRNPPKLLKKKSSLPSLKNIETLSAKAATNRSRMNSIDDDSFESKDSAMKQQQARIEQLDNFYLTEYWGKQFNQMLNCTDFSQKTKARLMSRFESTSPSIYLVIRDYITATQTNTVFDKNTAKIHMRKQDREAGCCRLSKYNMFKYIMQALQNQGKITDSFNRWLRLNFIDENAAVISAFESYLVDKTQKQFLQNLDLIMRMKNLRVQQTQLDTFVNRLTFFFGQIYQHPNMLSYTVQKYPKSFKGICQIYHVTANSTQLFQDLDLLNSYCFQRRFAFQLTKSFLNEQQRKIIVQHFNTQKTELIEGVIDTFENGREFEAFLMRYLQKVKAESRRKKLSCIEEIRSESRFDGEGKAKALLGGILEKAGRGDLKEKLAVFSDNEPKLASLWQLHEVTHSDEELIENLEILLETPQEDEHTKRFIQKLKPLLSPFLKARLTQKQPSLLKTIRKYSFGLPNSPQLLSSLTQYEKSQLPGIIRQTLANVGLNSEQIDKALQTSFEVVEEAVKAFIEEKKEESLLEVLQRVMAKEDSLVEEVVQVQGFEVKPMDGGDGKNENGGGGFKLMPMDG